MITEKTTRYTAQWRAYVGPPWRRNDAADFWDWSALGLTAYTPAPADTTLNGDVEPAADTITLSDASDFPTAGGCWLGPGTGETWEYITYTGKSGNDLTGVTRETVTAEQTGQHANGALVRFWWPLVLDEMPDYTGEMGGNLADSYWSATLKGHDYPQAALRNGMLCHVQARWAEDEDGDWGAWTTELVGWLLNPRLQDKTEDNGAWTCDLVSSRQMLDLVKVGGLHVGTQNVAITGSAEASPELGAAYVEWGSGEFTAAEPDLSPGAAIDGELDTLYLSEDYVGTDNRPVGRGDWSVYAPDQIHVIAYVGQGAGYRWVQMQPGPHESDFGVQLANVTGYWPGDPRGGIWFPAGYFAELKIAEVAKPLLLVESEALFRSEHPNCHDCYVYELSAKNDITTVANSSGVISGVTVKDWWNAFTAEGGYLLTLISQGASLHNPAGGAVWGNVYVNDPLWWTGASLAALSAGETIRRKWASNTKTAADWLVGRAATPSYWLDGEAKLWFLVQQRSLGLWLRDDIDSSQTSDIYITSDAGDTLDGLPPGGVLQIGAEQISYTAKASTNDALAGTVTRGANGTVASKHTAGDKVYVVTDGVATDALPISSITLRRGASLPMPSTFKVYGSLLTLARTPADTENDEEEDQDLWQDDYTLLDTVTAAPSGDYTLALVPSLRYRYILIVVTAMATDPYRLAINELKLTADLSVFSTTGTLESGTIIQAQQQLLAAAGFPSGAVVASLLGLDEVDDYTTDSGMCGPLVADLADYGGARYATARDSKAVLLKDSYWRGGALPTEIIDWDKSLAVALDAEMEHGLSVGQVVMTWRNAAGTDKGTVRYPPTAAALGEPTEIGPYIYADAAAALTGAAKRYWQLRRPYGALVPAAGPAWRVEAGDAVGVGWSAATGGLLDRTYLAQQARHGPDGPGALASVFQLLQISGESEV